MITTGRTGIHKSAKTHAWENPISSEEWTQGSDGGKNRCLRGGKTQGKPRAAYICNHSGKIALSEDRHRHCDLDLKLQNK